MDNSGTRVYNVIRVNELGRSRISGYPSGYVPLEFRICANEGSGLSSSDAIGKIINNMILDARGAGIRPAEIVSLKDTDPF